jgi:hypothetical protein
MASLAAAGGGRGSKSPSRGQLNMKTYTVYRVDYLRQEKEPVGKLVERRRTEREDNTKSLLRLAQKTYLTPLGSHIVLIPQQW